MLGAVGNFIGCALLNLIRRAAVPVRCPKCNHSFKPFADHTFTRFSEIMGRFPCPKCGHQFAISEDAKSRREGARFNPPGPLAQPANSRIERRAPSEHELLFYLPPSGRGGALLVVGVLWSLFMSAFTSAVLFPGSAGSSSPFAVKIFLGIFIAVGLGMLYAGLRQKYASHLLYLSSELVRLQRLLLFRSTFDLNPVDVLHVKLVEFYEQNGVPVCGIEISAGLRQIRFGSALRDDEKAWLAWEIREFLRRHGAAQLPPEAGRPATEP